MKKEIFLLFIHDLYYTKTKIIYDPFFGCVFFCIRSIGNTSDSFLLRCLGWDFAGDRPVSQHLEA
jgi:hypothetical protein